MPEFSERQKGIIFLAAASVLWSTGGPLIKLVDWNIMAIAGLRSVIALPVLIAFVRRPRFTWTASQIGAALCYAVTVLLFVAATRMTTAANAILLQYTSPIYIALFGGWFLGERATRLDWVTIGAVLAGMALFFLDQLTMAGEWGNILAIASGLTMAWLAMLLRKQKQGSPIESVILGNAIAALAGIPFTLGAAPGSSASWLALLLLGVFQLGLPYILFTAAIKRVSALEASLVTVIEPILNPLWVLIVVGERPGPKAVLGGVIVLGSITARGILRAWDGRVPVSQSEG
jgi:drug/metabolite transporter (DMT)-like permease